MKNLVVQYYLGGGMPTWANVSKYSIQKYCERFDIEYEFHGKPIMKDLPAPHFENLFLLYDDKYDEYDNILYLDIDIVDRKMNQNIFDFEVDDVGAVQDRFLVELEGPDKERAAYKKLTYENGWFNFEIDAHNAIREKYGDFKWKTSPTYKPLDQFVNTGLLLWSKKGREKAKKLFTSVQEYVRIDFGPTPAHKFQGLDQLYINWQFAINDFKITELPREWNNQEWNKPNLVNQFVHFTTEPGKKTLR